VRVGVVQRDGGVLESDLAYMVESSAKGPKSGMQLV
jgi:hypothetical protein